ncbi:SDR family oxidoreductase [Thalassospira sp. MCCC 1A01428]|uniref:SDR family oxidoreductase n=1 Tax=Thalassospira sp. MCCC 1A01428 TaxID=1470575 RepID=UPI000A1EF021|nr:SDR family oxidoreductase [Thalassospira sp. MCCC 1A01428]OSQ42047.1 oxidoreductase [Thalassospira sp. MCCC 1A01428]
MSNLEGKTALITGASSGIGAATARKLAEAGITVGMAARRTDRLETLKTEIEAQGGKAVVIKMDVSDVSSVEAGVAKLVKTTGSIDILFNNAGLMPLSDIDQFKTDEWRRMVDVNINGVLNTTAVVLPHMITAKSGHIFNTSSIAGRKVFSGLTVYCATKHAVTAFSDGLRMEVGKKHNIRVTCIQPGAVATELYDQISDPAVKAQMENLRNDMTFLEGDDIANTVLYAVQAPGHVDLAEIFIMPTEQGW